MRYAGEARKVDFQTKEDIARSAKAAKRCEDAANKELMANEVIAELERKPRSRSREG